MKGGEVAGHTNMQRQTPDGARFMRLLNCVVFHVVKESKIWATSHNTLTTMAKGNGRAGAFVWDELGVSCGHL